MQSKFKSEYKDYASLVKSRNLGYSPEKEEIELLESISGEDIYEIGFGFGDRLLYLKNKELNVTGGFEINPNIVAYGIRFNKINDYGLSLDIGEEINLRRKYKTIYTYKFLDNNLKFKKEDILKYCEKYIGYEDCLGGLVIEENQ